MVLLLLLLSIASGAAPPAAVLLNEVLRNPGAWNQMCAVPPAVSKSELPLYGYHRRWATSWISAANFQRLRQERGDVLREIALRLSEKSLPEADLEAYLVILLDLNGVEALPALLRKEAALSRGASYPVTDSPPPEDSRRFDAKNASYSPHVQVLSVVTAILKNESAPGLDQLGKSARYDKPHRDMIVELANRFLANTAPAKFRGAGAMTATPTYR